MCEQIIGTPLQPDVAEAMHRTAFARGAAATTAIEGNTLTTEQVEGILDGSYTAPSSRAYQQQEVQNVLDAFKMIVGQISSGRLPRITADLICDYNRRVLAGTFADPEAAPGSIRRHSAVVAGYRGAPARDGGYLLERLADWLESDTFRSPDPQVRYALTVISAVLAHLYLAWIHPFGDGNGRTARLLEFMILARSPTVPLPAAQLLSNHYNQTRDRYYRELRGADRSGRFTGFVGYAVEGFRDELETQIDQVRAQHAHLVWIVHVEQVLDRFPTSPARDRQRKLVLALSGLHPGRVVPRRELSGLSPELAGVYARTGPRTLSRDLNRLGGCGLIVKENKGWRASTETMSAFQVSVADPKQTRTESGT